MNYLTSQLKEVWLAQTSKQKKILTAYFIIGLPWLPMALFCFYIAKSSGTKLWPDKIEDKLQLVIMLLSASMVFSLFSIIIVVGFFFAR